MFGGRHYTDFPKVLQISRTVISNTWRGNQWKTNYKSHDSKWSSVTPLLKGHEKPEVTPFTCGCRYIYLPPGPSATHQFHLLPYHPGPKKLRRSPFPVLKGQFEQTVMEGSSHSVVAPWERASSRPRHSKKEKESWRLLNSVLRKLEWVQTCEISSRWELHNFSYKPKIEYSGSPAL